MKLYHHHKPKRSTSFSFANGKDSEVLFLEHLKKYPNDPCLAHYEKYPLSYKTNNFGFRSPDDIVKDFDGNIYLGCSHTWGIGHYAKNVWANILNEKVGGKCLNLGVPGSGIATGVRLLGDLLGEVKPKNIFCHYVHPYRYEFWDWKGKYWRTISPNYNYDIGIMSSEVPDLMKRFLAQEELAMAYYKSNFALLKNIAKEMGAKLHSIEFINLPSIHIDSKLPPGLPVPYKARDLQHFTTIWHQDTADRFYKAYTDNEPLVENPMEKSILVENKYLKSSAPGLFDKPLL